MFKQYKTLIIVALIIVLYLKHIHCCKPESYRYHLHLSNSCGASLLSPRYGLTSGHCCKTPGKLTASAGFRRDQTYEEFDQQRDVVQRILHPDFTEDGNGKFRFDFCLLKFDAFNLNKKTAMIALATKEEANQVLTETPKLTFFGYGGNIFKTVGNKTDVEIPEVKKDFACIESLLPAQKLCAQKIAPFNAANQICMMSNEIGNLIDVVDIGNPIVHKNLQIGLVSVTSPSHNVTLIARVDMAYEWINKYKNAHQSLRSLSGQSSASTVKSNAVFSLLFLQLCECLVSSVYK